MMEIVITLIAAVIAGVIGGLVTVSLHLTNTPLMFVVIALAIAFHIMLDLIAQNLARQLIGGAS